MTAQENDHGQNVAKGQFVLRRALRETLVPTVLVGVVVTSFYVALNTPWVQKYVEDLTANPRSVHFGHMFVAGMIAIVGLTWFLARLSALSKGVRIGAWIAMVVGFAGVSMWWLRGIYEESINGSSALTAAYNVIFIGAVVVGLIAAILVVRRIVRSSD